MLPERLPSSETPEQTLASMIAGLERIGTNTRVSQFCGLRHEGIGIARSAGPGRTQLCDECPVSIKQERVGCAHDTSLRDILRRSAEFLQERALGDDAKHVAKIEAEINRLQIEIFTLDPTIRKLNVLIHEEETYGANAEEYLFDDSELWKAIPNGLEERKQLREEVMVRHDEIIQRLLAIRDDLLGRLKNMSS